jgi:hypothetical protein
LNRALHPPPSSIDSNEKITNTIKIKNGKIVRIGNFSFIFNKGENMRMIKR